MRRVINLDKCAVLNVLKVYEKYLHYFDFKSIKYFFNLIKLYMTEATIHCINNQETILCFLIQSKSYLNQNIIWHVY